MYIPAYVGATFCPFFSCLIFSQQNCSVFFRMDGIKPYLGAAMPSGDAPVEQQFSTFSSHGTHL